MFKLLSIKNRLLKSEEKASSHINILTHYSDDTLLDKSDRLIKIIKVPGLDYVTLDEQILDVYKNRRNSLLKGFSSDFAFYFWEIRRKSIAYPEGEFSPGYANSINDRYKRKIYQTEMFHTEHYIAIIAKRPEGFLNKTFNIFSRLNYSIDKKEKIKYLAKRNKELIDATSKILSGLSDYNAELLSVYEENGIRFSSPLAFISMLLNGDTFSLPLEIMDVSPLLARKRLFFNSRAGTIEIRSADNKSKFAAVLSIKGYQPYTYQGILNELSLLNIEYVITQSFRPFDNQATKNKFRNHQKEMRQSKDESISQTEQIDEAFDDAASGEVGNGLHHFTLLCYADNQADLNKNIGVLLSRLADKDIACVRETIGCECGFWAQLPGNFSYVIRPAFISTKNMAAFASLYGFSKGKIKGNHWGDAVAVFETISGSPYYFNFHYKDVGNFQVFGAMGSGKTVLVGFLIAQSMKFGGKRIIFDKDRGLEILVRVLGGIYETIKPGIVTGFNPCQLDDTPANRKFLTSLLKKMLSTSGELLSVSDVETIERAVAGMYRLEKPLRQLCHISSFFGAKKSGSLRTRFDQWHTDGTNAWLFDNETDNLSLYPDVIGFDLGHILTDKDCKTPALMYLTYRVEQAIEGHRGILFCDEGWSMLGDDYFKEMINDWSRTPRKKNNIFGLATQVANDTANSMITKALNESAFCKIFFPNPSADKKVYMEDFGLTEHEYNLIKTMPDDQHYFLLNHGRSVNKQSVVVRVNLAGLESDLAIISARESSLKILDDIRKKVGNDPNVFLPLFIEQIKAGKQL